MECVTLHFRPSEVQVKSDAIEIYFSSLLFFRFPPIAKRY
jgi:hypothetical protein